MIVARITNLEYIENPDNHTVTYANKCSSLSGEKKTTHFRSVVANDIDDAVKRLSVQLKDQITRVIGEEAVKDFKFYIKYQKLNYNNEFWSSGGTHDWTAHKIV